jgi:hypothetical protein
VHATGGDVHVIVDPVVLGKEAARRWKDRREYNLKVFREVFPDVTLGLDSDLYVCEWRTDDNYDTFNTRMVKQYFDLQARLVEIYNAKRPFNETVPT